MEIQKNINKACFLRFLGSVSRKIGVFFGGRVVIVGNPEAEISKFISTFVSL